MVAQNYYTFRGNELVHKGDHYEVDLEGGLTLYLGIPQIREFKKNNGLEAHVADMIGVKIKLGRNPRGQLVAILADDEDISLIDRNENNQKEIIFSL